MRQITPESKGYIKILCKKFGVADNIKNIEDDGSIVTNDVCKSSLFGLIKEYKRIDFFDAITTIANKITAQSVGEDIISKTKKRIVEDTMKTLASSDANVVISKIASANTLIAIPQEEKKGPSEEEKKAAEEKRKQQEAEKQKKQEEIKKQQEEAKKKKEEQQKQQQQQQQKQPKEPEKMVPFTREHTEANGTVVREIEKVPMSQFLELVKANLTAGKSVEFTE